jgi:hypothetical protein
MASRADAEEFWQVRTVRLVNVRLNPARQSTATAVADRRVDSRAVPATEAVRLHLVFGLDLPDDLDEEGLLTPEDRAAVALDHIERTSDVVVRFEIQKFA